MLCGQSRAPGVSSFAALPGAFHQCHCNPGQVNEPQPFSSEVLDCVPSRRIFLIMNGA